MQTFRSVVFKIIRAPDAEQQLASLMAQNPSRAQVVILQQELRYQANIERGESRKKAEFKKAEEQFDSCFDNLRCKFSIC